MTANIQISGKADNGVIFVVGGNDVDEFLVNVQSVVGDRQTAEDILAHAGRLITPASTGAPAPQQHTSATGTTRPAPREPWDNPPDDHAGEIVCPTHQRPVKPVPKKNGGGTLYVCVVNDTFVNKFGEPGLKDRCPPPKQQ